MADKDASGRFDKQNERGGETSTEGKGAECSKKVVREGCFCLAKRGSRCRENAVGYVHVISSTCIRCTCTYDERMEKVVYKKMRFKERFVEKPRRNLQLWS